MKSLFIRLATSVFLITMLSACFEPETPQETAAAFWEAVVHDNAGGAARYSTLEHAQEYDGFGRQWIGLKPSWGRVVIDGDAASVVAEFGVPGGPVEERRRVVTYLVRQEGRWKVDYARTASGLQGGALGVLFSELGKLGRQLSEQFAASSEEIRLEMEAMGHRMNELSDTIDQEASERIERHGEALRKSIDALAASAREALKAQEGNLTEEEKRTLNDVAGELEEERDQLSEPNVSAMAKSNQRAAQAQQKLISINEEALKRYKQQWRAWQKQFEEDARQFLDELNAILDSWEANRSR